MSKTLRDLQASATHRRWSSEAIMNDWLTEQGVTDPELRIAAKHYFESTGKFTPDRGPTLRAVGELRTDEVIPLGTLAPHRSQYTPETAPVGGELRTLLRKANLDLSQSYTEAQVTDAFDRSPLGTLERIAVRHLLGERGCLRKG
jgi:hypothetical protein